MSGREDKEDEEGRRRVRVGFNKGAGVGIKWAGVECVGNARS